jgi:hypothetical protein
MSTALKKERRLNRAAGVSTEGFEELEELATLKYEKARKAAKKWEGG